MITSRRNALKLALATVLTTAGCDAQENATTDETIEGTRAALGRPGRSRRGRRRAACQARWGHRRRASSEARWVELGPIDRHIDSRRTFGAVFL